MFENARQAVKHGGLVALTKYPFQDEHIAVARSEILRHWRLLIFTLVLVSITEYSGLVVSYIPVAYCRTCRHNINYLKMTTHVQLYDPKHRAARFLTLPRICADQDYHHSRESRPVVPALRHGMNGRPTLELLVQV